MAEAWVASRAGGEWHSGSARQSGAGARDMPSRAPGAQQRGARAEAWGASRGRWGVAQWACEAAWGRGARHAITRARRAAARGPGRSKGGLQGGWGVAQWECKAEWGGGGASAEVFDPSSGRWTELPPMASVRCEFCAIALDGKLYAVGGEHRGGHVLASTEVFEPRMAFGPS